MEKRIKSICFILFGYPTKNNHTNIFVKQLIYELSDMGIECTVISPYSLSHRLKYKNEKILTARDEITPSGNKIHVYAPRYISLSSTKTSLKLTELTFKKAVFKAFKKRNIKVDGVYGHFIYPSGLSTIYIKDKLSIPAFLACGENSNKLESKDDIYFYGLNKCSWKKKLSKLNGIISVSSENKRLLIDNNFVNKNFEPHIEVFPNGTNNKRFYKMNRNLIRKELGIPQDIFIVIYTGAFSDRKGSKRLSNALNRFDDVYSIFIGEGSDEPICNNILFKGKVPHSNIVKYLNAADVFVLPTLAEGCCNAIVEALACGIPVISSNKNFNDDILNNFNSIRIDCNNVNEIYSAILLLKDNNELRTELSIGALKSSQNLNLKQRALNILKFMERSI